MSKQIFYQGQAVGCLLYGEGVVTRIAGTELGFPIYVQYNGFQAIYAFDGRYFDEARPTLYPIDQYRSIIANLPAPQPEAWKPKPGEWCWFGSDQYRNSMAVLARFAQMGERGYMAKINGGLSCYNYCAPFTGELPPHLKEVQP